jgi:hypothetical protein
MMRKTLDIKLLTLQEPQASVEMNSLTGSLERSLLQIWIWKADLGLENRSGFGKQIWIWKADLDLDLNVICREMPFENSKSDRNQ